MEVRVIGAILAGGRAERMGGEHKGLLESAPGKTIIGGLLKEMNAAGLPEVVIVANERERHQGFGVTVLPDLRLGMGPLAGVEAALEHVSANGLGDGVLFLPCDLPAFSAEEIGRLLEAFRSDPRAVKMAVLRGGKRRHQPLCCVVHVEMLSHVKEALDCGRLMPVRLWEEQGVEEVVFEDERPFRNINTPADLAEWLGIRDGDRT